MKLNYQKKINKIKDCPLGNEKGGKTLFRCVESKLTKNSFIPNAVLLKPKFQNNCNAWGLSVFNTYESASQMLKNLSKKKRLNYSKIAKGYITDDDGIKYMSKNKKHYTFFPKEELDVIEYFEIVNDD